MVPRAGLIRLAAPELGGPELRAVAEVLRSGMLVQGPRVSAFERELARLAGTRYGVCVSSGTAALHLALLALGVGPGDEVIVPDFTFPATGNAVRLCGAKAVTVDVDLETYNIDPERVEAALTRRTKAVIPVHAFGNPAELSPLLALARRKRLAVVEDAACALGARYRGRSCGGLGTIGCFSFHPRKVVTTGEGGALTTNDRALAERARRLRNHGISARGGTVFVEPGFNYRMTDFQAAMGLAQLERLPRLLERRAALAGEYRRRLARLPGVECMRVAPHARPVWQSFAVRLPASVDRDRVIRRLAAAGVEAGVATYSISGQPAYRGAPRRPHARELAERGLSLPLFPAMTSSDVARVAAALEAACRA